MLAILIDPEHSRWPEALPSVRFAFNTAAAPNQGTGHSAAYITFAHGSVKKLHFTDQIEKAIEAVSNGEKIAVTAQRFRVPRITLHGKITGKTPIGCSMEPSTILTKLEEDILERCLVTLSQKHIPITKDSLPIAMSD
ncbi:unnamed protein product [Leptidea sinapis]|uniref:HTH psq-type domain-containing protein n=1 Tax=Leptidea sinapis TaxID=189913 RepID=A0A5E4PPK7_9NEOP|nr:unnamed protein product [Leptidea sinapis]